MNEAQAGEPAAQHAHRLMAGEVTADGAMLTEGSALALAWALKDQCYAAWSSEPQSAVRAADLLHDLTETAAAAGLAKHGPVMQALAAWARGIAHIVQGDMEAAVKALDAAAHGFAGLAQPLPAALTQVPKIMALAMLGQHEAAAQCAETAQRDLSASGDHRAASKVALNRGHLHMEADQYASAAACFRQAADLFNAIGDAEHAVMADIGLADALTAVGDLDDAAAAYAQAGESASRHNFPVLQAMVEESLSLLYLVRGRFQAALAGMEGARRRYAALQMPQHLAIAHKQLSDAYLELRMLPEALAGYDATLASFRALDMPVERAWTLVQRGRCMALLGHAAEAGPPLAEAGQLFERLDNNTGAAAVALAQAELALSRADAAGARALAEAAAARFAQAGRVDRRLQSQIVQARSLLALGDADAAAALFEATLQDARRNELLPVQLRCLSGRAMTRWAAGPDEAARPDLEEAVELFESLQRSLPGDELRSAFQSDHLWPFQALLELEMQAHEQGRADAAVVLLSLDRFRANALADRLSAGRRSDEVGPSDETQAATHDQRARLAWLYRRLNQSEHEAAASAGLTAELRKTEHELLERARRVRLAAATGPGAGAASGLDIGRLQQALQAGDALVEYGLLGDELLACVVTGQGVQVVRRLAAAPQVLAAVQSARLQIETLRHGNATLQRHLPLLEQRVQGHMQRLHALLWRPLAPLLSGCTRVMLVSPAQLSAVPWAALHDGERCLAQALQIALAPSARIANDVLSRSSPAARCVLALGESTRLPHAATEAQIALSLFEQGWAFVGSEATGAQLRVHAHRADTIHLACHGQFRADNPAFSALHLHDGPLTAESIETLRLAQATVVLSGCETALSDTRGGDEMFGLTRAFLVAGASRVVAALWPVDDATTLHFMTDFYGGLQSGLLPAAALQQAQLRARDRQPHPFFWAPFTLTGRW